MGALCVVGLGTPAAAAARQPEVRVGAAPRLPAGTKLVAGIAAVKTMRITVALAPRDPSALNAYAHAVGNPSSPDYHHYLTPAQFRQRFAPARSALVRVETELRAHGLHPGSVSANGLEIHLRASGTAVQRAFSLTLSEVRLPDGRRAVFNSQAPALSADVAHDVQSVVGLSDLAEMDRLDIRSQASTTTAEAGAAGTTTTTAGAGAAGGATTTTTGVGAAGGATTTTTGARTAHTSATAREAHIAGAPQACPAAALTAPQQDSYTTNQIAAAYDFDGVYQSGDFGKGVTVGVYELESNLPTDIDAYQQCYGTDANVSYVKVDGGAGSGAGQGEAALDIEQVIGLAPRVNVIVYQGPNNNADNPGTGPYDVLAAMVSEDQAKVLTNSWGECEAIEGSGDAHAESTLLEEAAVQGQTFVTASGDSGSEDCWSPPPGGNNDNALAVDDPGSQPFATAVGGTSLTSIGPPPVESAWDDDSPGVSYRGIQPGAGGGGISTVWQMPTYQAQAATGLGVINSNSSNWQCGAPTGSYCREVPDVSADADPMNSYLDYWNGDGSVRGNVLSGWQGTGGTSGAAPVWAAVFALADASSACRGSAVGFANPALYALAGEAESAYFNDVVTGNNDFTPSGNTAGLYPASAGYDMATGLGSPKAAALVPALCSQAITIHDRDDRQFFLGQRVRVALRATLAAGQIGPVTYLAAGLPAGVHIDKRTGVVSGVVTRAGVHTITVSATSASGGRGAVQFTWTVAERPRVVVALTGPTTAPKLVIAAASGSYESGLRNLTVTLPHGLTPRISARAFADAVKVQAPDGQRYTHTASYSHGVLTLHLAVAHSPLRIVFDTGTLRISGQITGSVTVLARDLLGGQMELARAL